MMTLIMLLVYLLFKNTEAACVDTNGYWDVDQKRCVCFEYNKRGLCKNTN